MMTGKYIFRLYINNKILMYNVNMKTLTMKSTELTRDDGSTFLFPRYDGDDTEFIRSLMMTVTSDVVELFVKYPEFEENKDGTLSTKMKRDENDNIIDKTKKFRVKSFTIEYVAL
jgi:hypothetical protein